MLHAGTAEDFAGYLGLDVLGRSPLSRDNAVRLFRADTCR